MITEHPRVEIEGMTSRLASCPFCERLVPTDRIGCPCGAIHYDALLDVEANDE